MKTRNGFVSNSSSSSFTCVLSKVDHEAVLAEMDEKFAGIMRQYVQEGKVGDLEVVGYGFMGDAGGNAFYSGSIGCSDDMEIDGDDFYDAEDAYGKIVIEKGFATFGLGLSDGG